MCGTCKANLWFYSSVKHIVDTKDEQIEIDKQRKEREGTRSAAKIRKARKDRIWIKKRAKERNSRRENAAQEPKRW